MSTSTIGAFLNHAVSNAAVQAKLREIEHADGVASVVRIAAEEGFVFTPADYEDFLRESASRDHAARELTDDELGLVAAAASSSGGGFATRGSYR